MINPNFRSRVFRQLAFVLILISAAACGAPPEASNIPLTGATASPEPPPIAQATQTPQATQTLPAEPSPTGPLAGATRAAATLVPAPTATFLPTEEWRPVSVSGCPVTQAPEVAEAATLTLGPAQGIPPTTAKGERLVIVGTVYAADCTPLANASLNVWQTDADGVYGPGHDTGDLECCYLQGQVSTDENGHYQLDTFRPGHYAGQQPPPPAHIHVEANHASAGGLMTEIVFADDGYLPENALSGYTVVAPEPFAGPDGAYLYTRGVADLVLPGSPGTASPGQASPASGQPAVRTFEIQPQESEAAYHLRERFALLPIETRAVGVTRQLAGRLEIEPGEPPALRSLEVEADLRALQSDEPNRDDKLADQWLVTDEFPQASFAATRLENPPQRLEEGRPVSFTLHGEMTIREVTRPAAFQVTARLSGGTLIGTATGTLKMSDFGIEPPNLLDFVVVEDEIRIVVNLVAEEVSGSSGN